MTLAEEHHRQTDSADNARTTSQFVSERRKIQIAQRRSRYVAKARLKREALRQQVHKLSTDLEHMRHIRELAKEKEKKTNTFALGAWRAAAAHQKDRRMEAQDTQRQLKAAVIRQSKLIHQLETSHGYYAAKCGVESLVSCGKEEKTCTALLKTFVIDLEYLPESIGERVDSIKHTMISPENGRETWNQHESLF
ncbi:unnamed protein product [Phytophthora lilii]|uniref:Unnamed protein product n=1 Tax=Phytophthora lilii TaxID=2077276 RepID=A0A9W6TQF5_9STRA|nr:unnamed protein product [Phytophthora lilii]